MTSALLKPLTPSVPTLRRLANGLTIIAEQMPVDAVNLNLWLNVGSAVEPDKINGMAHFLEHMVFKGTPNLNSGEFERRIEQRGAATNAATSQEYTHYYVTCAPKDLTELAPLQLDVVLNPSIADEAFERERLVVLEEIRRSNDNPRRRTYYRAMELCFEQLPYRRPVLGPESVIEGLTPQQMRDFHRQWYQPELMTAAVVGNLPVDELIAIVTESFEQTDSPDRQQQATLLPPQSPEPSFREIVRREYEEERLQQARLVMVWRVPGMQQLEETYALDVLAAVLGQGRMSRLFRDLREERQLVTSIGVSNMTPEVQGTFYISARLPADNVGEVEAAIAQHIRRVGEELVSDSELARIRTQVANRFIFSNERPSNRANLYGYYHSQLGDLEPAFAYPSCIQSVEAADVQAAARRYLSPEAYGIVVMRPA